jgi:hypothetical protein
MVLPLRGMAGGEGAQSAASSIHAVLPRAKANPCRQRHLPELLFSLFGVAYPDPAHPPVAAVSLLGESGLQRAPWCMRADPVGLIPNRGELVLVPPDTLQITPAEAQQLAQEVQGHFADQDWELQVADPRRWYLRLEPPPDLHCEPLPQVIGRNIHQHLPAGADALRWHGYLNELQMLLHGSAVNQRREQAGEQPINSLWLWGEGDLPEAPAQRAYQGVFADAPLARGLARLCGIPDHQLPDPDSGRLAPPQTGRYLLLADRDRDGRADETFDTTQWEWLEVLKIAVKSGTIQSLNVYPLDGARYHYRAGALGKWLKNIL